MTCTNNSNLNFIVQVNLDMTDSTGPGKLIRHMQNLSYTYDKYLICIGLGPSISSVICKNPSYSGLSYPSSPVYKYDIPMGVTWWNGSKRKDGIPRGRSPRETILLSGFYHDSPQWDVIFVLSYKTTHHLNWVLISLFSLSWDTCACYFLYRCSQQ